MCHAWRDGISQAIDFLHHLLTENRPGAESEEDLEQQDWAFLSERSCEKKSDV